MSVIWHIKNGTIILQFNRNCYYRIIYAMMKMNVIGYDPSPYTKMNTFPQKNEQNKQNQLA